MLRHQCMIYAGSPNQHLPRLAGLIVANLSKNHRSLYLNSPAMVAGLRSYLAAAGVDVEREIAKGTLVLSSSQAHLVEGAFDIAAMLALLQQTSNQAKRDGYDGLWVSGDMTWEFGPSRDFMKLFEYECQLEELLQKDPFLSGVCQYHVDSLPRQALIDGLQTHPAIYINETLSRINPHYASARKQQLRTTAADLKEMLADLQLGQSFEV